MTAAMTGVHDRSAERGQAAIEFAIVFLLFFAMLWGILTFGFIFAAQNTLTLAAENGARAALRYQPATAARISAATTMATQTVQWLQNFTPAYDPAAYLTATSAPCTYNANLICFHVQISYPYAQHPLIPPFPGFGLFAPTQLVGKATMQVDPGNLLPGG
ncbi:TadE/TadG family type IV pilus assembly protein [Acidithiobacillus ferrooxidans]|uniref:TadE/TadG family type IV pilus assembly protein n=2 Tax=Acidithiobacillus ferrooxidans TaxID=920 RepID=UPI00214785C3|nr:TadE family protein [Acidithiobacillus ferrooxidans]MCR1350408.1 pilus assembly protein [Acidithiobacillus ferrooxidans]MCR1352509.1 pilus assembly protein [Acidithiobacillus ferrooxidans]